MKSQMLLNMEARYLSLISEFDFTIERVAGKTHCAVDGLSRVPCHRDSVDSMCNKCRSNLRVVRKQRPRSKPNGAPAENDVIAMDRHIDGKAKTDGVISVDPLHHSTAGACGGQVISWRRVQTPRSRLTA